MWWWWRQRRDCFGGHALRSLPQPSLRCGERERERRWVLRLTVTGPRRQRPGPCSTCRGPWPPFLNLSHAGRCVPRPAGVSMTRRPAPQPSDKEEPRVPPVSRAGGCTAPLSGIAHCTTLWPRVGACCDMSPRLRRVVAAGAGVALLDARGRQLTVAGCR
jgi:hypothetical protein